MSVFPDQIDDIAITNKNYVYQHHISYIYNKMKTTMMFI